MIVDSHSMQLWQEMSTIDTASGSYAAPRQDPAGWRVLITGAAGFFGLALTRAFARSGCTVLAIDAASPESFHPRGDTPLERVSYRQLDITDRHTTSTLAHATVDLIVHAAALTPTALQQSEEPERIVDVNLGGTLNLLAAARCDPHCRRFVLISSAGVYDQTEPGVLHEDQATGGSSLYGTTKIAAEHLVRRYGQLFDLDTIIVRPTSLYGPGERVRSSRPSVTSLCRLVEAALRRQAVRIDARDARCDWLYVDDAADAVLRLASAERISANVFNLSMGRPSPFSAVIDAVAAALPVLQESGAQLAVDGSPDRPAVIANDRLRSAIDWHPYDLVEGVQRYLHSREEQL